MIAVVFLALRLVLHVALGDATNIALGLGVGFNVEVPRRIGRTAPIAGYKGKLARISSGADIQQRCGSRLTRLGTSEGDHFRRDCASPRAYWITMLGAERVLASSDSSIFSCTREAMDRYILA